MEVMHMYSQLCLEERVKSELRKEIKAEIKASEKRMEKKLEEAIKKSQQEIIEVLSELIQTGYEMHDIRITKLEKLHSVQVQ